MDTNNFAIAIMAAGKGTRLKSKRPKVLHEIGGRAHLLHVIAAAKTVVPADHIYCIIGHESDRVRTGVAHTGVQFVLQAEQRGTGHAMQMLKVDFELSPNISSSSPATCRSSAPKPLPPSATSILASAPP